MRTAITMALVTLLTMLAALPAAAEVKSPTVIHDPLMKQIMSRQLTQPAGGLTGAVRIGSGQTITLNLIDPLAPLKPVEGLVEKPAKKTAKSKAAKKVQKADVQLKKMSKDESRADWAGRSELSAK